MKLNDSYPKSGFIGEIVQHIFPVCPPLFLLKRGGYGGEFLYFSNICNFASQNKSAANCVSKLGALDGLKY